MGYLEIGIGVYDGVTEDLLSTDIRDVLKEFLFNSVVVLDVVIEGCADWCGDILFRGIGIRVVDADGEDGKGGLHQVVLQGRGETFSKAVDVVEDDSTEKRHCLRIQVEFVSDCPYPEQVCWYLIVHGIIVYGLN